MSWFVIIVVCVARLAFAAKLLLDALTIFREARNVRKWGR